MSALGQQDATANISLTHILQGDYDRLASQLGTIRLIIKLFCSVCCVSTLL